MYMYFINYRTFHFQMQPLNGKLHKRTTTHAHPYTHTHMPACMYVCISCYKCIFVFHFCFCFASCLLFGAVLLTWLKLEHNNNKPLQWNFATHTNAVHTHTRACLHVFVYAWSLTHTVSWKPYSAQLILLCCCCCFFFFRSLRLKKKINKILFALFTAILHTLHAVWPIHFILYSFTYIYFVFCDNL